MYEPHKAMKLKEVTKAGSFYIYLDKETVHL